MASSIPPKKNTAYTLYVYLVSQADTKVFQANPTLAAGDVKVCIDDGAPANLATLPVVDADHTKRVKVSLSADEMNGDHITLLFADAAGAEWCDLAIEIETAANTLDEGVEVLTPAEASGRPTTLRGMIRRLWEGFHNKRTRDRATGAVAIRNDADSADLETSEQSTAGDVDTITEGA